jgi:DNA-binding beta-propeller fold protein YncE
VKRAVVLVSVLLAGCGSMDRRELPPAAEPARSPHQDRVPAGRTIPLPTPPEGVVADPVTGLVAVGLRQPDEVALVDGRAGRLVRRVAVPESPRHLQLERPGGPVLVPSERADRLATVALPSARVRSVRVGSYPHDATAAGGRVFVGDEHGHTVTVLEDGHVVGRFPVALQPGGLFPVEGGRQVAVVSVRERVVETYDTRTLERVGRASVGVGPTHVVSNGRRMLYVADTAGDGLVVLHTRPKLEVTRRVAFPGGAPYGIAYDGRRDRLWVTLTGTNEVAELSAGTRPGVLRRFPAAQQPDTVAVDTRTGRVFVTGLADQVRQLFDPPPGRRTR